MSNAQRWYITGLVFIYKPIYHGLMVFVSLAVLSYIWIVVPIMIATLFVAALLYLVTLLLVRLRNFLKGVSNMEKEVQKVLFSDRLEQFLAFFFVPIGFVLLIAVLVPVTLRLSSRAGYW